MVGQHGLTVEEWHKTAGRSGGVHGSRAELLDGEAIEIPAVTDRHSGCIRRLTSLLAGAVGDRAIVSVQNPVVLDEFSEPVPDVALLSPRKDGYDQVHPTPADVILIIEVSDSPYRLTYDRGRKASHYSGRGIRECWVVDIQSSQIIVMRYPASGGYREQRHIRRGASPLTIEPLEEIEISVEDVLGPG